MPIEEVPLLSLCAPAAPAAPAAAMLSKSQTIMPLGTPNFHQMSMPTQGATCKSQYPNPNSKPPKPQTINQSLATMPLGTLNFHQRSM